MFSFFFRQRNPYVVERMYDAQHQQQHTYDDYNRTLFDHLLFIAYYLCTY
jgi:hypothetical protein